MRIIVKFLIQLRFVRDLNLLGTKYKLKLNLKLN